MSNSITKEPKAYKLVVRTAGFREKVHGTYPTYREAVIVGQSVSINGFWVECGNFAPPRWMQLLEPRPAYIRKSKSKPNPKSKRLDDLLLNL